MVRQNLGYNTKNTSDNTKLDFIKVKNFCSSKGNIKKTKRHATDWEKTFANHYLVKNVYTEYIKNYHNSTQVKTI